jgi:hypothetical protein
MSILLSIPLTVMSAVCAQVTRLTQAVVEACLTSMRANGAVVRVDTHSK